jgi:hypothetical protein
MRFKVEDMEVLKLAVAAYREKLEKSSDMDEFVRRGQLRRIGSIESDIALYFHKKNNNR